MQRRKRDRSSTPRRRRRHKWSEEQRRLANRAKSTRPRTRSAPSRAPEVIETSSTRAFPRAPWRRAACNSSRHAEVIQDDDDGDVGEPASSSRAGPPVPSLNEFDPSVRWWSNLTGFTDPFDHGDVHSLLSPETSRTLIANLQGLDAEERAKVTTSLLAFVGLFIAELMKVVNDAQFGERVGLLQRWTYMEEREEISFVQHGMVAGPGTFAKKLLELQAAMENNENKGKSEAAAVAQQLRLRLDALGPGTSRRTIDRRDRLRALLVAFHMEEASEGDMEKVETAPTWESVCPFIEEAASANGTTPGALDSDDEREGVLVQRRPGEEWKPATHEEAEELRQHDRQQRQEAEEQARADDAAFSSLEAARAQAWEDWAMYSELRPASASSGARKRVRAVVTMATAQRNTVAKGIVEGDVMQTEEVMMMFVLKESLVEQGNHGDAGDDQKAAPLTPSTVLLPETQMEHHVMQAREAPDVDLDSFMNSKEGAAVYQQWNQGELSDEKVSGYWGKDVLELFQVTKTIEDRLSIHKKMGVKRRCVPRVKKAYSCRPLS